MVFKYGVLFYFRRLFFYYFLLSYYVVFSKLVLVNCSGFCLLFFIWSLVSSFHFSSHLIIVFIHSIIARLLYIMFHQVFVFLHHIIIPCFIAFYHLLVYPLGYHIDASCYELHLTASLGFSSFNTIPLSLSLASRRTRMFQVLVTVSSFLLPLMRCRLVAKWRLHVVTPL